MRPTAGVLEGASSGPQSKKVQPSLFASAEAVHNPLAMLPVLARILANLDLESRKAIRAVGTLAPRGGESVAEGAAPGCYFLASACRKAANEAVRAIEHGPSTDADLAHLAANFPLLETLWIGSACSITPAGWAGLSRLPRLRTVVIPAASDGDIEGLSQVPSLERLDVGKLGDDASTAGLAHLARLPSLRSLKAWSYASLTDEGVEVVSRMASLRALVLSGCFLVTGAGLRHLLRLSALEELSLGGSASLTDADYAGLSTLPSLRTLSLKACVQLTDAGLEGVACIAGLRKLDLSYNRAVSNIGVACLTALTALRELDLSRTSATRACLNLLSGNAGLAVKPWL